MYFESKDDEIISVYQCHKCKNSFHRQVGFMHVSCAVAHEPGDCCHYGERQVSTDQVSRAKCALFGDDAS